MEYKPRAKKSIKSKKTYEKYGKFTSKHVRVSEGKKNTNIKITIVPNK